MIISIQFNQALLSDQVSDAGEEGIDARASAQSYGAAVEEALHAAYPAADIECIDDPNEGTWLQVYPPELQAPVAAIVAAVALDRASWLVPLASDE